MRSISKEKQFHASPTSRAGYGPAMFWFLVLNVFIKRSQFLSIKNMPIWFVKIQSSLLHILNYLAMPLYCPLCCSVNFNSTDYQSCMTLFINLLRSHQLLCHFPLGITLWPLTSTKLYSFEDTVTHHDVKKHSLYQCLVPTCSAQDGDHPFSQVGGRSTLNSSSSRIGLFCVLF